MYFRDDYGEECYKGFSSMQEAVKNLFEDCAEYDELNEDGTYTGNVEFHKGITFEGAYAYAVLPHGNYMYLENVTQEQMIEEIEYDGYWDDDMTELEDFKHFRRAWFVVKKGGVFISECGEYDFSDLERAEEKCRRNGWTLKRHDNDFSITEETEEEPDPYDCGYCSWADLVQYYEQGHSAEEF